MELGFSSHRWLTDPQASAAHAGLLQACPLPSFIVPCFSGLLDCWWVCLLFKSFVQQRRGRLIDIFGGEKGFRFWQRELFVVPVCVRKRSNTMQLQFAGMDFTCVLDSLEKYQIPEKDCFLPLLSKSLGYAIVCGSVFLKVPQVCFCLSVCLCLSLRADSNKLASVLYLRDKCRGLKM